ncbi:selenide, water dikinase SelD [Jannaschia rubra]|uniref:selenide, water dikinase SelD n=1 Tax=Jannaschia rubra TaxID=282197 RepID=UPI002492DEB4|nr:selenide, water dikinase SelD [Jannaschia rubra]
MQADIPLTRDLVLVGGGHAHALVLRKWGMDPLPGARLSVINPGPTAPYTGMLPGHVAGHYTREELDIDLLRLARFAGARLIDGAASGIDLHARLVTVPGRPPVAYDVASIDVGITAQMPEVPGFAENAVGAKPLDVYARSWRAFREAVRQGARPPRVAVIGGGIAGQELAMAMAHALRSDGADPQVTVLEAAPVPTGTGDRARALLDRVMAGLGVTLRTGVSVARVGPEDVTLDGGERIPAAFIVGAAGARPHGWLTGTGLPLEDGFIRVGPTLAVEGRDDLFAAGDCAHLTHAPRPKAGVFAVREAPILHHNLRAALTGGAMRAFRPQKHYLKLVSLGGKAALAQRGGLALSGEWLWRWKDRIDRTFMGKLTDLPTMAAPALPRLRVSGGDAGTKPLCSGCGSKIGGDALAAALTALPSNVRDDVLSRPGDDAAVLAQPGGGRQVITTDHLRAFTPDTALMVRIAAVHALGDVWAMGARPQAALASIILPRMSEDLQARTLTEAMAVAAEVMSAAGAEIVGGHSTMGAETTIGFTVTGLHDGTPIGHGGAQPGDAIVLTRPIGTGVILAAEMAGKARGADVVAMLNRMSTPQGDAAAILSDARAMTDVTGFGLAGHLSAICRASGVGADLILAAVPVYAGAEDLAASGHASTLFPANRRATRVTGGAGARLDLLHDPQTAGGLLAAVPADRADALVAELRAAGHDAARIGTFTDGPPGIACV